MTNKEYFNHDSVQQLKKNYKIEEISQVAAKSIVILNKLYYGIHHLPSGSFKKKKLDDWKNPLWFNIIVPPNNLATFDGDFLTRLVFLAHDHAVRIEIKPKSSWGYIELTFHERKREGQNFEKHPTIEQALEKWRNKR